ncbi:MAG TPA: glycosyltransferase 87 family protein [Terriglobales bacterium]|nr:glycosyltransferase 87 family protein [Terriglobales bacterium]
MRLRIWFLLSLFACAISYTYRQTVLAPWEHYLDVQHGVLKEAMGDLYSRWVGTRELLLHGRNPYGEEVSHEIQIGFYGRTIEQNYHEPQIIDEQRFAYPIYVVLFLAPSIHTDFATVRVIAVGVLALLTAASVVLWVGVVRWRPPPLLLAAIILFVLSSPQLVQGLRLQQLGLLVGLLVALATWCLMRGRYALAGGVLAVATIKPQMVLLCIAWLVIWTFGSWSKRWPLIAGFTLTLCALIGVGELLFRGWICYFLAGLIAYRKYDPATPPMTVALGPTVGTAVSIVTLVILLGFAWRRRSISEDSWDFVRILGLFFITTLLVFPLLPPFNQVLILLPVLMVLREWDSIPRLSRVFFTMFFAWPWAVSSLFLIHRPQTASLSALPLLPSVPVPFLPLLLLIFLPRTRHQVPSIATAQ